MKTPGLKAQHENPCDLNLMIQPVNNDNKHFCPFIKPFERYIWCILSVAVLKSEGLGKLVQALFDWHTPLLCCYRHAYNNRNPFILRRKKRAIRMMATVVLLFAACWAPFHLVSLLLDYGNKQLLVSFPPATFVNLPIYFFQVTKNQHVILLCVRQLLFFQCK